MDGKEANERPLGRSRRRPRRRPGPFWLLARHEGGRLEVLAAELAGGKTALPVFSFAEEAGMFLKLGGLGEAGFARDGWRVRETGAGELASVLLGPCRHVGRVALDPLPGTESEAVNRLVSVGRERFVDFLLRGTPGARPGSRPDGG